MGNTTVCKTENIGSSPISRLAIVNNDILSIITTHIHYII